MSFWTSKHTLGTQIIGSLHRYTGLSAVAQTHRYLSVFVCLYQHDFTLRTANIGRTLTHLEEHVKIRPLKLLLTLYLFTLQP